MNCKPLFIGRDSVGDRFDSGSVYVFFGNKKFSTRDFARLFPERHLCFLKQIHSNQVHEIISETPDTSLQGDAFITKEVNLGLGIYTADCLSVLFHDPSNNRVAACHAGWRGIANNIIPITLKKMVLSSDATQIRVWIGPHIHKDTFEVHNDVAKELQAAYPGQESVVFKHSSDTTKKYVDLTKIAQAQLTNNGVLHTNIWTHSVNTFESHDYYSYRRSGPTGRLISFICLLD